MKQLDAMKNSPRKKKKEAGADRMSDLPQEIPHIILSFLDTKQAVQTSVLCKSWGNFWRSYPIFDIDQVKIQGRNLANSDIFIRVMRHMLATRDTNYIKQLRILSMSDHNDEVYSLIHTFITKAVKKELEKLDLKFSDRLSIIHLEEPCQHCYILPTEIFSSGSSLVYLNLDGCLFGSYDVVKFSALKTFSLKNTSITEQTLFQILSGSPSLETLTLENCSGFTTLRVTQTSLRCLILNICFDLRAFEMDIPNLQYFKCTLAKTKRMAPLILGFNTSAANSFPMLTHVKLSYVEMKDDVFQRMISRCPNLEAFYLQGCTFYGMLRVHCRNLKTFEVDNCAIVGSMEVDGANLQSVILKCKSNIQIRDYNGMGFSSLRVITFSGLKDLTNDYLRELLSGCSVLEVLKLQSCKGLNQIEIFSAVLESLIVEDCRHLVKGAINAPKLVRFKYVGGIIEFSHIITSPQLEAEINFSEYPREIHPINLRDLLRTFDQARTLTLVSKSPEVIIIPKDVSPFPSLFYMRHLIVKTYPRDMTYTEILLGMLHTSVCRETMCIELGELITLKLKFQDVPDLEDLESVLYEGSTHNCIQEHLVESRVENFRGDSKEMALVQYLLGKATLLKSFFISFSPEAPSRTFLETRINNFKKVSPFCSIEFI